MTLSSASSSATSQLPYLQSLYQSGLLTLGKANSGSTAASGGSATSGGTSSTVVQISDQALALQDNATLLGSATGAGADLPQALQQLDALALQASGQGSNSGGQALADVASAALGLSNSTNLSVQNTDLAGTSTLLGSLGVDSGSLLSSLADLSTQYQNQLSLSDLGLAGRSDAGSSTSSGSDSSSDSTSTTPASTTLNATQQALSLYQTLQQQGLSQLLASA
jgi:hypothetical protein